MMVVRRRVRLSKLRATTVEWCTAYPWHFGGSIPSAGPVVGVDQLTGGAPFGMDPFAWVEAGIAQNPNVVVAGDPGNGKSALVKQMVWWLVGAFGYRFVATDVKGEYGALAAALAVPVLDLHPGGSVKVNPLDATVGRLEFTLALASLCVERALIPGERAALAGAVRILPADALVADLAEVLRQMPAGLCDALELSREQALQETKELRFGLGDLLAGEYAGMFDGPTNVDLAGSPSGFVIDVSGCGSDDRSLRFALLVGMRAADQLVGSAPGRTLLVNDECWRLAGTRETVRWLQHSFKLGRAQGKANIIVMHRLSELGVQADGSVGQIAARLVSDADTQVLFRQGDRSDADDSVERLRLPAETNALLSSLHRHRCLVHIRGRIAVVDVALSARMGPICDTNAAMRPQVR